MINVNEMMPVEWAGQHVLTTRQVAQICDCTVSKIHGTHHRNKGYFTEGKHFFKIGGADLKDLKFAASEVGSPILGVASSALYLWTREGVNRLCAIMNTPRTREVSARLDEYFGTAEPARQVVKMRPAAIIEEIGLTKAALQKVYGGDESALLEKATNIVAKFYGQDLKYLKELMTPAEPEDVLSFQLSDEVMTPDKTVLNFPHDEEYMNVTQVGKRYGWSPQKTNEALRLKGAQIKDRFGCWLLTDIGRKYGGKHDYFRNANGKTHSQIYWSDKVFELLGQPAQIELV